MEKTLIPKIDEVFITLLYVSKPKLEKLLKLLSTFSPFIFLFSTYIIPFKLPITLTPQSNENPIDITAVAGTSLNM